MKLLSFDFFKKNIIAIVLGFGLPFLLWFYFQRDAKEIKITYDSNISAFSINDNYSKQISVLFDSKPIDSMNILTFTVENSGNRPIEKSNYDMPITITPPGTLLSAPVVIQKSPEQLEPTTSVVNESDIQLNPLLLNPGDQFTIQLSLTNYKEHEPPFTIKGRIVGVNKITTLDKTTNNDIRTIFNIRLINAIAILLAAAGTIFSFSSIASSAKSYYRAKSFLEKSLVTSSRINISQEIKNQANILAERLDILGYDYKSMLLFLRIKLEELITALSVQCLPSNKRPPSIAAKLRLLSSYGPLSQDMVSAINDILSVMDNELHSGNSYINAESYNKIQETALEIIGVLESYSTACTTTVKSHTNPNG